MDEEDEFDDIELDAVALAAVAGGWGIKAVVEPVVAWHPMRKWLFSRQPVAQTENPIEPSLMA